MAEKGTHLRQSARPHRPGVRLGGLHLGQDHLRVVVLLELLVALRERAVEFGKRRLAPALGAIRQLLWRLLWPVVEVQLLWRRGRRAGHEEPLGLGGRDDAVVARLKRLLRLAPLQMLGLHRLVHVGIGWADGLPEASEEFVEAAVRQFDGAHELVMHLLVRGCSRPV